MWGDKGKFGATEVHTLFNIPPKLIDKTTWDNMRIGMVCMLANTIADIQSTVDRLCNKHPGSCSYETQQRITAFKINFHRMLASLQKDGVPIQPDLMKVFWTPQGEMIEANVDAFIQ